jgi:hypothetical protein
LLVARASAVGAAGVFDLLLRILRQAPAVILVAIRKQLLAKQIVYAFASGTYDVVPGMVVIDKCPLPRLAD